MDDASEDGGDLKAALAAGKKTESHVGGCD